MPADADILFADHAGRFYARRYGMAPMVGRVFGYLVICAPSGQSIAELAEALLASQSAIAGAVNTLDTAGRVGRVGYDRAPNAFTTIALSRLGITAGPPAGSLGRAA